MTLKGLKKRSHEEETRWQSVREERRRLMKMEANRMKRAGYSEEQNNAERERNREQRAKLTKEEAAAATRRNTDRRRMARAKIAEGENETVVESVVETVVETVVVVVPYTGEPPVLNHDKVAAFLGREGMDEGMGRQYSTNSVVEKIIVNTVFDMKGSCQNLEKFFEISNIC